MWQCGVDIGLSFSIIIMFPEVLQDPDLLAKISDIARINQWAMNDNQ